MKQYDDVFKQMDNVFKEMDNVFKAVEKKMNEVQTESDELLNSRQKWEPHISWIPRKIGKQWYWHSHIYRKPQFKKTKLYCVYGTEFDVLKASR